MLERCGGHHGCFDCAQGSVIISNISTGRNHVRYLSTGTLFDCTAMVKFTFISGTALFGAIIYFPVFNVYGFNINVSVASPHQTFTPVAQKPSKFPLTWEPNAVAGILEKAATVRGRPLVVALVGIPGSGKSTSCHNVADLLERCGLPCMVMPFDGYHIPVNDLKQLSNADDVIYRRGAPDTFDPKSLKGDLLRIKNGNEEVIKFPDFDHAKGDPEPDKLTFMRHMHSVVVCEGLYLLHNEDEWDLNECFDFSIFIESDVDTAMNRLKIRNQCIPGYSPEEIEFRVDAVDRVNAHTVNRSRDRANLVVEAPHF